MYRRIDCVQSVDVVVLDVNNRCARVAGSPGLGAEFLGSPRRRRANGTGEDYEIARDTGKL
jgi:hypothetical protein